MNENVNEIPSEQCLQNEANPTNPDNDKNRCKPGSREDWAEVLATAERYY